MDVLWPIWKFARSDRGIEKHVFYADNIYSPSVRQALICFLRPGGIFNAHFVCGSWDMKVLNDYCAVQTHLPSDRHARGRTDQTREIEPLNRTKPRTCACTERLREWSIMRCVCLFSCVDSCQALCGGNLLNTIGWRLICVRSYVFGQVKIMSVYLSVSSGSKSRWNPTGNDFFRIFTPHPLRSVLFFMPCVS
jgi:hypothetical protein